MITIRPGQPEDVEILAQFSQQMAQESEDLQPDPEKLRAATKAALADPAKARYFIAQTDHPIASLFVTREWSDWNNGWYWWIQGVYVQPQHRRAGIYARLYKAVQEAATEAGDVVRIMLYVEKDNAPARAAYAKTGMTETPYRIYQANLPNPAN